MRFKPDIPKLVFFISFVILVAAAAFAVGLYSGAKRNAVFSVVAKVRDDVKAVVQRFTASGEPEEFLQPSRKPGAGVTINERAGDNALVLMAGFFDGGNALRLIRRDGTVLAKWKANFSEHFPDPSHLRDPPATDLNIDTHGALIDPDGSILFNYEYGGAVKLDRCGKKLWTIAKPTHHSVEHSEKGGYWIPGRRPLVGPDLKGFPPFTRRDDIDHLYEDFLLRVSKDGKILEEKSVPRILYDNGLEPLLTSTGTFIGRGHPMQDEFVHLNKIAELPKAMAGAFKTLEAGDLVLSIRHHNMIMVVDPDDWRVKWYQIGPWRRQHDPEFNSDGTISLFNNNVYVLEITLHGRESLSTPRISEIMKVDPATGKTWVVYGNRKGQELLSVIRGKQQPLAGGGFLITEFEGGRVFEVDAKGRIVWEYINRYDADQVLEVTEGRLYPSSYFTVKDWSCPAQAAAK